MFADSKNKFFNKGAELLPNSLKKRILSEKETINLEDSLLHDEMYSNLLTAAMLMQ